MLQEVTRHAAQVKISGARSPTSFLTALVFLSSCVHGQTEAGHSESKLLN